MVGKANVLANLLRAHYVSSVTKHCAKREIGESSLNSDKSFVFTLAAKIRLGNA